MGLASLHPTGLGQILQQHATVGGADATLLVATDRVALGNGGAVCRENTPQSGSLGIGEGGVTTGATTHVMFLQRGRVRVMG